MATRTKILLIDLPTFPKGQVSLSLYAVAAAFCAPFEPEIVDLNFHKEEDWIPLITGHNPHIIGLKVSAQNFELACKLSQRIQVALPTCTLIWGGEFPTLMPKTCAPFTDVVVQRNFEGVAAQLMEDYLSGRLQPFYEGFPVPMSTLNAPRVDLIDHSLPYSSLLGLPLETSRGCTFKCTFCMVHQMQPGYEIKTQAQIQLELSQYSGQFLNVVDYNIGLDKKHLLATAATIEKSQITGWKAEMCLESLDDDEVLVALSQSRCRIIYCGLESIDETELQTVNKARTNQVENYRRIIKKVQSYGIHIGAGVILGLPRANEESLSKTRLFFEEVGTLYAKLTFLTYNPGTKVNRSMGRLGTYPDKSPHVFDGNHLSFIPQDTNKEEVLAATKAFITEFYSDEAIARRAETLPLTKLEKEEWILFNRIYRIPYMQWLEHNCFHDEASFQNLLLTPTTGKEDFWKDDNRLKALRADMHQLSHGYKPHII